MIELRHIRVFLALAEELHFGRTALRMHVAQSAISQTIRQLEEELGTSMFSRTRREVRLSRAGEAFRVHAQAMLRELEHGAEAARRAIEGTSGRLVIRCVLTAALSGLPELIARYRARYPGVVIDLADAGTTTQLELVRAGRCDLAIVPFQRSVAPLAVREIAHGKLCAIVPRAHRYARRRSIALAALADEDLVFLRREVEPQTHRAFVGRCREAGFDPRIAIEVDQLEMMLGSVSAGLGVACISSFVSRLGFPGIVAIPITPTIATKICAVWDPQQLAPTAQRFLELIG